VEENILQGSSSCGHHMGGMCNCCCRPVTLETTRCCPMCQAAREELSLRLSQCSSPQHVLERHVYLRPECEVLMNK